MTVVLNSTQQSSSLASGILQGIANGTFLYVTFFEIFQQELAERGSCLLKVLSMIVGYSVVTGLLYYANVLEHGSPDDLAEKENSTALLSTAALGSMY